MAFTVSDFQDLLALLKQNPDWLAELRQLIIADDFQKIETALDRITEELRRTRIEFEERTAASAARQESVDATLAKLAESQLRAESRLARLDDHSGKFMGFMVEERLRRNAPGYFGRQLNRAKVVLATDLPLVRAADGRGELADHEWRQLSALDIVVRGFAKNGDDSRHEVVLAIEASSLIHGDEVDRANRRAEILRRVGYDARAWVGGAMATQEAIDLAERTGVQTLISEALAQ